MEEIINQHSSDEDYESSEIDDQFGTISEASSRSEQSGTLESSDNGKCSHSSDEFHSMESSEDEYEEMGSGINIEGNFSQGESQKQINAPNVHIVD